MYTNQMNLGAFLNMLKENKNPQEMVMGVLKERANENPVFSNLMQMVNNGDTQGVEKIVRNIAKEKGIDFDKEFNSFKQMFKR